MGWVVGVVGADLAVAGGEEEEVEEDEDLMLAVVAAEVLTVCWKVSTSWSRHSILQVHKKRMLEHIL